MTEAIITGIVAIVVCMINNHFQQRSVKEQNGKTIALIDYKLTQLEKRVEEHNNYGQKIPVIEEQIKVLNHRISDLEEKE